MAGRQLHNASILRLLYLYSYNTVIVIHTNVHYSTLHVPIGQTIHCDDMLTMRLKDVQTRSLVVGAYLNDVAINYTVNPDRHTRTAAVRHMAP